MLDRNDIFMEMSSAGNMLLHMLINAFFVVGIISEIHAPTWTGYYIGGYYPHLTNCAVKNNTFKSENHVILISSLLRKTIFAFCSWKVQLSVGDKIQFLEYRAQKCPMPTMLWCSGSTIIPSYERSHYLLDKNIGQYSENGMSLRNWNDTENLLSRILSYLTIYPPEVGQLYSFETDYF